MTHPTTFTFLGFHFNSLVDANKVLDLKETHTHMRSKSLFPWLKQRFGNAIDISLFTSAEIDRLETFFESLSVTVDEKRKMGVENNGLCLLVAYCFEGAQRKPEDIR